MPGASLFKTNCANCHNPTREIVGPPLLGFESRGPWSDRSQLYEWIKNPEAFMKNNSYTRDLRKNYSMSMSPFPNLTHQEIDEIADYINSYNN